MHEQWISHSVEETLALGERFAMRLRGGDVVALRGDLGTGKTHLVKGICKGLGFEGVASSPTFALINEYDTTPVVYHVDLYRLDNASQVPALGLEELMRPDTIMLVEWPEVASTIIPADVWRITCAHGDDDSTRTFSIDHNE